ncbi:MAG TPA: hypothetical protein VFG69_03030 [Nannocystaceae bacterium]|nr:hypothetical protein [Nannocystaceae bacterium]
MQHPRSIPILLCLATAIGCGDDSDQPAIETLGDAGDDSPGTTAAVDETTGAAETGESGAADGSSSGGPVDVGELAACPEDDIMILPWAGPAFDQATGELVAPLPLPHVVATTAGWPKDDGWDLLQSQTNIVIGDVFAREGLLGASFGISMACGSARTITMWEDEAAMLAFVTGEAHATAIATALSSTRAWETTHWSEATDDQPPTWDRARAELDAVRAD